MTAFRADLHPRARKGSAHGGRFIDVVKRMEALDAEWDDEREVWIVPEDRVGELGDLLDDLGTQVEVEPDQGGDDPIAAAVSRLEDLSSDEVTPTQAEHNRTEYRQLGPTEEQIASVAERWTGAGVALELSPDQSRQSVRDEIASGDLDLFLGAARNGAEAPALYRAIPADLGDLQPGSEIDMRGVSSFTSRREHAEIFGRGRENVTYVELADARGLPVKGISNTPWEDEWLLVGRMRVDEVVMRDGHRHVRASWHPTPSRTGPGV
jgi:hypothetical protein